MITQGAYHGDQRSKVPVLDMGSETGNVTLNFTTTAREFFIMNDDDTNDLSFTITDQDGKTYSFTLKSCESLDDRYVPFGKVVVTATGAWRWIAKSGRVT